MAGVLYIVATPIGNLDDITYRAIRLLKEVDFIAAEDTRHSLKLLNHWSISNQLLALHDHNEQQRKQHIIDKLLAGDNVALISDAGTPLISDPGYHLVNSARAQGIQVSPVPGASSIIAALSCAGLPTNEFTFVGFLSQKNKERLDKLQQLKQLPQTIVLLESTHRIIRLLEQIDELMPETQVVIAKELTKSYERFISGTAADCLQLMTQDEALAKGEFVVMLSSSQQADSEHVTTDIEQMLKRLMQDLPIKTAAKIVADLSGLKKNELYQQALKLQ